MRECHLNRAGDQAPWARLGKRDHCQQSATEAARRSTARRACPPSQPTWTVQDWSRAWPSAPGVQATLALLLESFVTVMLKGAAGSAVDGDLESVPRKDRKRGRKHGSRALSSSLGFPPAAKYLRWLLSTPRTTVIHKSSNWQRTAAHTRDSA